MKLSTPHLSIIRKSAFPAAVAARLLTESGVAFAVALFCAIAVVIFPQVSRASTTMYFNQTSGSYGGIGGYANEYGGAYKNMGLRFQATSTYSGMNQVKMWLNWPTTITGEQTQLLVYTTYNASSSLGGLMYSSYVVNGESASTGAPVIYNFPQQMHLESGWYVFLVDVVEKGTASTTDGAGDMKIIEYGGTGGGFVNAGNIWHGTYNGSTYGATVGVQYRGAWFQMFYDDSVSSSTCVTTCIQYVVPVTGSIVSTTTPVTIGASLYVAPDDFEEGMYLSMSFHNQTIESVAPTGSVLDAWNAATNNGEDIQIPITASGTVLFVSTTTNFLYNFGRTIGTYRIIKPSWLSTISMGLLNGSILASMNNDFVIGAKTGADIAFEAGGTAITNWMLTGSSTVPITNCNGIFTGSDITGCLVSLLVPSASVLKGDWESLYNGAASVVPFGYFTRFCTIMMTLGDPVEPPALTYTFGSSSPAALQGMTYSMQVFDHFDKIGEIRSDDGQNKNVWDIVDPYIRTLVAIAVLFVILDDLMGFDFGSFVAMFSSSSGGGSSSSMPESDPTIFTAKSWERYKNNRYPYYRREL